MKLLEAPHDVLQQVQPLELSGTVAAVRGLTVHIEDLPVPVGAMVRFEGPLAEFTRSQAPLRGEVVGFEGARSIVMPFHASNQIAPGMRAVGEQVAPMAAVGESLLGRVIDGLGHPIDGGGRVSGLRRYPLRPRPVAAMRRARVVQAMHTGVRAIDGFLPLGVGQRIGIFSAAGVGKSTLLASIARHSSADVNVIALIGERGREAREFLEDSLSEESRRRTVAIVATSDESPLLRVRAALTACAAAEYFRDAGASVMLVMDSITRLAHAQRQIGLATGEPPATRGYPPSVFALLPAVLERAGAMESAGAITGFYSVLVEGDDLDEPVSDAVRGLLDGHIVLSRTLAARQQYPAIDLLQSISRASPQISDAAHQSARETLSRLLSAYAQSEELINIGGYVQGADPLCDAAIAMRPRQLEFLNQSPREHAEFTATRRSLIELADQARNLQTKPAATRRAPASGGPLRGRGPA